MLKSKILWYIAGIVVIVAVYNISSYFSYSPNNIIGRHYEEIVDDYGVFSSGNADFVDEEKRYKYEYYFISRKQSYYKQAELKNAGTYKISSILEADLGPNDRKVFPHIVIEFDDNGYAISVTKGYLYPPGG